jgi:hypothetical protein
MGVQCLPAAGKRLDGSVRIGLRTQPGLGLSKQVAQLLEQLAGGGGLPVEGLDPVESIQDCACLVHDVERTRAGRACLCSVCA